MKVRTWVISFIALFAGILVAIALLTAYLDPFFLYRAPREGFYYELSNERAQNIGIVRHFDYDAVITGTSMTQNFKASEVDALFDVTSVKVSFSGATYKELADLLDEALATHEVKIVIRDAVDVSGSFVQDKEYLQEGFDYPRYLYNRNPFDDVQYLLNRDVLAQYVVSMLARKLRGESGGVTSFDDYSAWGDREETYGREAFSSLDYFVNDAEQAHLSEDERAMLKENLEQNVLRIAREHPDTTFYLFVPPYSIVSWGDRYARGEALKYIEAEEEALTLLLGEANIRVYSFSTDEAIVCDLAHYRDAGHYDAGVNSYILQAMASEDARYLLTAENVDQYIRLLSDLVLHYHYEDLRETP